jgi:hypothetical protein
MSVISALCLLIVLTSYRDISVLAGELRWTSLHCMVKYSESTGCEKPNLLYKIRTCSVYYGSGSHFSQLVSYSVPTGRFHPFICHEGP